MAAPKNSLLPGVADLAVSSHAVSHSCSATLSEIPAFAANQDVSLGGDNSVCLELFGADAVRIRRTAEVFVFMGHSTVDKRASR